MIGMCRKLATSLESSIAGGGFRVRFVKKHISWAVLNDLVLACWLELRQGIKRFDSHTTKLAVTGVCAEATGPQIMCR